MNFTHFCVISLYFLIFYIKTESLDKISQICYSKVLVDKYTPILKDLFSKFSKSNESHWLRSRLSKENISISCLSVVSSHISDSQNISFDKLISTIADRVVIPFCVKTSLENSIDVQHNLRSYKMWIYGFISVTIINACAALGMLFSPMMKQKFYKIVMTFMISLAVGSLTGSALLILIPDAMQLSELQQSSPGYHVSFKYKATVVFGGVYMFFLLERFLKWIIGKRVPTYTRDKTLSQGSINISRTPKVKLCDNDLGLALSESKPTANKQCSNGISDPEHVVENVNLPDHQFVTNTKDSKKKIVSPVAWMIIFGDALHNFIDGLSIGAAFSRSPMTGISLSIAVLCEELPHELGDFAILLNAGMTVKQALMWNMMSAATCYIGFIIGVILGEMTSGSTWVFAIAGGMFLYISLVDMMPEMNAILENKECSQIAEFGILNTFIIQNIGLLLGYALLLMMALYGDHIKIN